MTKNLAIIPGVIAIVLLAGWGTSKETNIAGDKKHSKNFHGTLETWTNPPVKVDNISIDNLFAQIPLYVKPSVPTRKKSTAHTAAAAAADKAAYAARVAQEASASAKKMLADGNQQAATGAAKAAQAAADAAEAAAKAVAAITPQEKIQKQKLHMLKEDPKVSLIEFELDLVEVDEIRVPHPDETWVWQEGKGHRKVKFVEMTVISKGRQKTKSSYLIEKNKKIYCDKIDAAGPGEQKVPVMAIKSLKIEGYTDRDLEERKKKEAAERETIKRIAAKDREQQKQKAR